MDDPDPAKYRQFLINSNIDTFTVELRIGRRLLAVSVMDHVANGLSAVYTFFDPDESYRGPGTLMILKQIELARRIEYDWLYLGYWIKDCQKMAYKNQFHPLQAFCPETGIWTTVD
jgi:arginine-tRNA-protein transferase